MSTDNGTSAHLQYSDERFGEIAVELGVLKEEALDKVLKLR